jgi:bifunctional non-homologous end joining protein LigD
MKHSPTSTRNGLRIAGRQLSGEMQKGKRELRFLPPMECLEVAEKDIPKGKEWCYEIKHDGYRTIAVKQNNEVMVYSRNGKMLAQFPNIYGALLKVPVKTFILDGELTVLDDDGRASFALTQKIRENKRPATLYVFDVLHVDGDDLLTLPLRERRRILENSFSDLPEHVRLSPILRGKPVAIMAKLREMEFEGIIAKRWDSVYEPGKRSGAWQKHKTQRTGDFIIGGYIGDGAIEQLVVGETREGKLHFVESVKNGFVPATRREVYKRLHRLAINRCPFVNLPEKGGGPHAMDRQKMREVHWLKPIRTVELAFNERTSRGHLRHSKFLRLRDDKVSSVWPRPLEQTTFA